MFKQLYKLLKRLFSFGFLSLFASEKNLNFKITSAEREQRETLVGLNFEFQIAP